MPGTDARQAGAGALRFGSPCLRVTAVGWIGSTWKTGLRRGLAVACGMGALACIRWHEAGILLALPLGIVAGLLALPELLSPFFWLIDSLFGTGMEPGRLPPLDLCLARFYVQEERWEEAFAEYERILGLRPWVEEAYLQLFKLGARLGRSERWGAQLLRKAQRRIRDEGARFRLAGAWEEAREIMRAREAGGCK